MKLFELTEQYNQVRNLIDEDVDNETLQDTLESLQGAIEEKLDNIAFIVREMDYQISALDEEAKRMRAKKERLETQKDGLKNYILQQLQHADLRKVKTAKNTIYTRITRKVEVDNLAELDSEYIRVTEKKEADKKKLKEAIDSGQEVKGVRIVESESVQMR
jgi:disulfide oxidoreductase YuzD